MSEINHNPENQTCTCLELSQKAIEDWYKMEFPNMELSIFHFNIELICEAIQHFTEYKVVD